MATAKQIEAQQLYLAMLEEAKVRIECLNIALSGRTNLPERGAVEFGYLQLRMLCEIIALGCLVVHGDIEETKALRKTWAADDIVRRLARLHPDFYPHPAVISFPESGHIDVGPFRGEFLTRGGSSEARGRFG